MPILRAALVTLALASATPAVGAESGSAAAAPGDARRGEALFTGERRLENGGAPCLACHGVVGHGLARAASFGPDLTAAYASYGAEALDAALADVPFPSMTPLYRAHALTPRERGDLCAFLSGAGQGVAPSLGAGFALGTGGIAILFLAASVAVGRGAARARRETP